MTSADVTPADGWSGLVDQGAALAPDVDLAAAVAAFRAARADPRIGLFGLPDDRVAAVTRHLEPGEVLAVVVTTTGGAGGLVALARRRGPVLDVVGAVSALRDLDDLPANAARVVAAAAELDPEVVVSVEVPAGRRWTAAAEVVEAAGLQGQVRADAGPPAQLAEQLSALVELDLPFRVAGAGLDDVGRLVLAVDALVDGADPADAAVVLTAGPERVRDGLAALDAAAYARIRRRLRAVEVR